MKGGGFSQVSGSVLAGQADPFPFSIIAVVWLGLLFMRAFQRWALSTGLDAMQHLNRQVTIAPACVRALIPWGNPTLLSEGVPLGRVTSRIVVSTDASLYGWGALCQLSSVRGGVVRGSEATSHKLFGVAGCLSLAPQLLRGKHVLVRTDNMTVVSYINRQGGTCSLPLLQLTRKLLMWSKHLASLRAVHVMGHLNGGADMLSRGGPQVREWRLHPWIVAQIWDRFGRAEVDLFASAENTLPAVFLDHRQERSAGCERSVACMAKDPAVCVSASGSDTAHSRSGTQMEWAF